MSVSKAQLAFMDSLNVSNWNIDNSLGLGTVEARHGRYFLSEETLAAYNAYLEWDNSENSLPDRTVREEVLDEAKRLTMGDREDQYGSPYDHFSEVARVLNAFGYRGPGGRDMSPRDVPLFQMLVKLSRINKTPDKMDSWIDIAGYAACGAEVAEIEAPVNE